MQTVALSWQEAAELGAVLTVAGSGLALAKARVARSFGALVREAAVIAVLYALWQVANQVSLDGTGDAGRRARWIRDFEGYLPLPSEHTLQHLVLGQSWLVQGANLYYAAMHMTTMLVFLVWLFVRHRDRYRPVRQVMAWTTLGCLLVQLVPVAPPRMQPDIVDTGLRYGQSVYSNGLPIDQLSAMPSIHVAWAVLIGYYTWQVSPSRWRVIGPIHAVVMVLVVVVTGNHWWLDGIVAVLILVAAAWGVHGVRLAYRRVRAAVTPTSGAVRSDSAPDSRHDAPRVRIAAVENGPAAAIDTTIEA